MKKILKPFACCLLVILFACSKNDNDPETGDYNLRVSMVIHCGWASCLDSLSIDGNYASLKQNYRANSSTIKVSAVKVLEDKQIESLKTALDWNYFSSLNYNSGDLGADGCDIWLRINRGNQSHAIRFSPTDTIPQLRAFTDQLDSIWSDMGNFPPEMLDNF